MSIADYKFEVSWASVTVQGVGRIAIRETITGTKGYIEYGPMDEADGLAFVEGRKQYWSLVASSAIAHGYGQSNPQPLK